MNTDHRFQEDYTPEFGSDLKLGQKGELWALNVREKIAHKQFDKTQLHAQPYTILRKNNIVIVVPTRIASKIPAAQFTIETLVRQSCTYALTDDGDIFDKQTKTLVAKFGNRVQQGNNKKWDVERTVDYTPIGIHSALLVGSLEVKTDVASPRFGNFYFEYECNGEPSGAMVSEADLWCHIIGYGFATVFIPVNELKKTVELAIERGMTRELRRGARPTKGAAIPYDMFVQMAEEANT